MTSGAPPLLARVEIRLGLAFWAAAGTAAALCGAAAVFVPFAVPVLLLMAAWPRLRHRPWAANVLDWLPFPLVVLTYEMLHAVATIGTYDQIADKLNERFSGRVDRIEFSVPVNSPDDADAFREILGRLHGVMETVLAGDDEDLKLEVDYLRSNLTRMWMDV